jgi:hypothetical protein
MLQHFSELLGQNFLSIFNLRLPTLQLPRVGAAHGRLAHGRRRRARRVRPAARSSTRAPWLAAHELGRGVAGHGAGRPRTGGAGEPHGVWRAWGQWVAARDPGGGGTGSCGEERGGEREIGCHILKFSISGCE